jgi:hypothetical protein
VLKWFAAAVMAASTLPVLPAKAQAVAYCTAAGVPGGCVARPASRAAVRAATPGVGTPGVGVAPGVGAGARGVGVAPAAGAGRGANRGGPVNRAGAR